jgi:hypothetical protein
MGTHQIALEQGYDGTKKNISITPDRKIVEGGGNYKVFDFENRILNGCLIKFPKMPENSGGVMQKTFLSPTFFSDGSQPYVFIFLM